MAPVGVAVESGARWRRQVVAHALGSRGVEVRDREEAEVLVLLDGTVTGRPDAGRTPVIVRARARPSGADDTVTSVIPDGCTPDRLSELVRCPAAPGRPGRGAAARGRALLSPRELEVLRRLADGASNADIAYDLGLSRHTVRTHVQNLLAKLGTGNRAGAVAVAHRLALLT